VIEQVGEIKYVDKCTYAKQSFFELKDHNSG